MVYKWTDADGVVHYSDQSVPGSERIVTSSGSSNGLSAGPGNAGAGAQPTKAAAAGLDYSIFAIESPAKEQVFFGDDVVPIRLHLEPGLQQNQSVTWHLNGKQLDDESPQTVSFALQGLARGTYVIAATVTDILSGESKSSDSITFYVRQPSELSPQHKKP